MKRVRKKLKIDFIQRPLLNKQQYKRTYPMVLTAQSTGKECSIYEMLVNLSFSRADGRTLVQTLKKTLHYL